jgi:hypothetical protein
LHAIYSLLDAARAAESSGLRALTDRGQSDTAGKPARLTSPEAAVVHKRNVMYRHPQVDGGG